MPANATRRWRVAPAPASPACSTIVPDRSGRCARAPRGSPPTRRNAEVVERRQKPGLDALEKAAREDQVVVAQGQDVGLIRAIRCGGQSEQEGRCEVRPAIDGRSRQRRGETRRSRRSRSAAARSAPGGRREPASARMHRARRLRRRGSGPRRGRLGSLAGCGRKVCAAWVRISSRCATKRIRRAPMRVESKAASQVFPRPGGQDDEAAAKAPRRAISASASRASQLNGAWAPAAVRAPGCRLRWPEAAARVGVS